MPKVKKKTKIRDTMLKSILCPNNLTNPLSQDMPIASSSPVQIGPSFAMNSTKYELIYKTIVKETKLEYDMLHDLYSSTISQILQVLPKDVLNCLPSVCNVDQGENGIDVIDSIIVDFKENDIKKTRGRPKKTRAKGNEKDDKMDFQKKLVPLNSIANQVANFNLSNRSGAPLLLRKPNMEEMVISLNGTPIKATTDTSRDVELTIPVGDGKVISLLPNEELVGKKFPKLDSATLDKLTVLGKILNSITKKT